MNKIIYNVHHVSPDTLKSCFKCKGPEIEKINLEWSDKCKNCAFEDFLNNLAHLKGFSKKEILRLFQKAFDSIVEEQDDD